MGLLCWRPAERCACACRISADATSLQNPKQSPTPLLPQSLLIQNIGSRRSATTHLRQATRQQHKTPRILLDGWNSCVRWKCLRPYLRNMSAADRSQPCHARCFVAHPPNIPLNLSPERTSGAKAGTVSCIRGRRKQNQRRSTILGRPDGLFHLKREKTARKQAPAHNGQIISGLTCCVLLHHPLPLHLALIKYATQSSLECHRETKCPYWFASGWCGFNVAAVSLPLCTNKPRLFDARLKLSRPRLPHLLSGRARRRAWRRSPPHAWHRGQGKRTTPRMDHRPPTTKPRSSVWNPREETHA